MVGISFVESPHLQIFEGCFLPRADVLGHLANEINQVLHKYPELKPFIPNLHAVDIFMSWDEEKFMLFISTGARAHLPIRGMNTKHLPAQREAGIDLLRNLKGFEDISDLPVIDKNFRNLGFEPGFAAAGTYPFKTYGPDAKKDKIAAGVALAELMRAWAEERRLKLEKSKIFLSHKGANKPFIAKVDSSLRMLGLRTWFDQDDLAAGAPLVRGVDDAFANCSAAVFFISREYVDAGVIGKEIERAIHESAMRGDKFRVIPLVLAQHGGTDNNVPEPLKTLVWKTVDDIDVVPTILRSLPILIQDTIRYFPLK